MLYSIVREYIGDTKDKVVFDLYSGTGTIAQLAASVADEVIGVEIVEEAVEAAKQNAALNNLSNCKFIAGNIYNMVYPIRKNLRQCFGMDSIPWRIQNDHIRFLRQIIQDFKDISCNKFAITQVIQCCKTECSTE